MGRRAVAKLDRFYFVSIQARSAVPQSRSAAAPGAVRRPPQILPPLKGGRQGKGLIRITLGTNHLRALKAREPNGAIA